MRVSSSQIFNAGVRTINSQMASLLHVQQQVASGRRILTPSDDPVAAARALEVTQSESVVTQFQLNHNNASSALGLEEAQLSSASDLIARVRELTVQAGNTLLSNSDRRALSFEMRARFDELVGIANATDGAGLHVFSGFMGTTKPFDGTVDFLNASLGNEITYQGDEGQRRLQVSTTRFLEISDSGTAVFTQIKQGNGTFTSSYGPTFNSTNGLWDQVNSGTGIIDGGVVISPATWADPATPKNYVINFGIDNTVVPPVTYYDIVDNDPVSPTRGNSLLTGAPSIFGVPDALASDGSTVLAGAIAPPSSPIPAPTVASGLNVYRSGQPISIPNAGANVLITGDPAQNDSFTLNASGSQSIFKTMANVIKALETATTENPAATAKLANDVGFALTNLDQGTENILRVRAAIGTRLKEVDSLGSVLEDLKLQFQLTLSQLQDLDYAKAITDLTRKQTDLQAAQQSFVRISELSLFNYLR